MLCQGLVCGFPQLTFRQRGMWPVDRPQQLRLQLRAVLLQVQCDTRLQSHLPVAVGQNDKLTAAPR